MQTLKKSYWEGMHEAEIFKTTWAMELGITSTQTDELKSQVVHSLPPFHSKENFSAKVVIFQYSTDIAKIRKENCNC